MKKAPAVVLFIKVIETNLEMNLVNGKSALFINRII